MVLIRAIITSGSFPQQQARRCHDPPFSASLHGGIPKMLYSRRLYPINRERFPYSRRRHARKVCCYRKVVCIDVWPGTTEVLKRLAESLMKLGDWREEILLRVDELQNHHEWWVKR